MLFLATGSAAVLLAADQLLFQIYTFDGCQLTPSHAKEDDYRWWKAHVGALPKSPDDIGQPNAISGRAATWWHPRGGHGADGASGTEYETDFGVAAFDIGCRSALVTGRALASIDRWAYRLGPTLPLIFMERTYVGVAGADPGHPAVDRGPNGWTTRFRTGYFALNALLLAFILDYVSVCFGRFRTMIRTRRGGCAHCGYTLLPSQSRCPECGAGVSANSK